MEQYFPAPGPTKAEFNQLSSDVTTINNNITINNKTASSWGSTVNSHEYTMFKFNGIVVLLFNFVRFSSVTKDTWSDLCVMPSDCVPSSYASASCALTDSSGNIVGTARVSYSNYKFLMKPNISG